MTVRRPLHVCAYALAATTLLVACSDAKQPTTSLDPSQVLAASSEMSISGGSVVGTQNQVGQLKTRLKWYPTWVSRDSTIVAVTSSGMATGVRVGTTYAVATNAFRQTDSLLLTVNKGTPAVVTVSLPQSTLAPGQTMQAVAVALDANSKILVGAPITWTTSSAAIATISSAGTISAVTAGAVSINATSSGLTGSQPLSVSGTPPPVASVTVSMPTTSIGVGQAVQATAVARDANGNVVPGVAFSWASTATAIATVSSSGLVSGVSTGSAQVRATASGASGSLGVTITTSTGPGPNGLTTPPALPQVYLNFPYTPATGKSIYVAAGGNLQNAINSANRGDEIVLQSGAVWTGNFTLPVKSGTVANGWITIRGDKFNLLPPEGTRVTSANASLMPRIQTASTAPAIATQLSASGYRLVGLEITVASSYTGPQYGIVLLGDGSSAQNAMSKVATDLVIDRSYIHGQTNSDLSRCIGLHSARTQISDSYVVECHGNGYDAQAILGYNGPGPYKIVNNTLIGSTENVMFGGADPWIAGVIPSDIEIRRNYFYTPPSWKGVWLKKNLFELKAARRVLAEGNVFDGSWQDGQTGWALVLKAENQSGGCTWCTTSDLTVRYNYIRNAGAGIAVSGKEGSSPYPVGALLARISVQNNVVENINVGVFQGDARLAQVMGNPSDVEFVNNTFTSTGYLGTFFFMDLYPTATRLAWNRNATSLATYGMLATGRGEGTAALGAVAGGWQFNNNYLIGSARSGYPASTSFIPSLSSVPTGYGADQATINSLISGVIVP